jgi:hypothetical protein
MTEDASLLPGRLLRRPGPPERVEQFPGVQIDDPRLAEALGPDAPLLRLYDGTVHGEGTVWSDRDSWLYWSDVPNRRLRRRARDGRNRRHVLHERQRDRRGGSARALRARASLRQPLQAAPMATAPPSRS